MQTGDVCRLLPAAWHDALLSLPLPFGEAIRNHSVASGTAKRLAHRRQQLEKREVVDHNEVKK